LADIFSHTSMTLSCGKLCFLPVLAYDGANMTQIDAGGILDIAMAGTSATLLARKWESTLPMMWTTTPCAASWTIPRPWPPWSGSRAGARSATTSYKTIINKSETVKALKNQAKDGGDLAPKQKKQITEEEKDYKSKRKAPFGGSPA